MEPASAGRVCSTLSFGAFPRAVARGESSFCKCLFSCPGTPSIPSVPPRELAQAVLLNAHATAIIGAVSLQASKTTSTKSILRQSMNTCRQDTLSVLTALLFGDLRRATPSSSITSGDATRGRHDQYDDKNGCCDCSLIAQAGRCLHKRRPSFNIQCDGQIQVFFFRIRQCHHLRYRGVCGFVHLHRRGRDGSANGQAGIRQESIEKADWDP